MNKNEKLRKDKERGIKEAIKYLHRTGIKSINNKSIANTTKLLFSNEPNNQISANTLSKKEYYRNNLGLWIAEITESDLEKLKKGRENSIIQRKANAEKNYLKIEKESKRITFEIIKGKIICENFSKDFLIQKLLENKEKIGYKINKSMFSTEFYKPIYAMTVSILNQEMENDQTIKGVSLQEFARLKKENKRLMQINNNLINNLFFIKEEENDVNVLLSEGLAGIILDSKKVYHYFKLNEDIIKNSKEITIDSFFIDIISKCRKN